MAEFRFRLAKPSDSDKLLEIYAPYIRDGVTSFEYTIPSTEEFSLRIEKISGFYPWLICEHEGRIVGYAYASKQRDRHAYQWNVECSVYVATDYQKQGIASKLYNKLFAILKKQGIINVYAGITLPNSRSEKFHRKSGFATIAIYNSVGYKFGAWHDVLWLHKVINDYPTAPFKPIQISDLDIEDVISDIG